MRSAWLLTILGASLGITLGVTTSMVDLGILFPGKPMPAMGSRLQLPDPRAPQPKVQVDQEKYEFGKMEVNTSLTHDFVFTNVGSADLRLIAGESSCKCTLSQIEEEVLKPGESTKVTLTWKANMAPGPFRQSAKVHTNDRTRPLVELFVEGQIAHTVEAVPEEFNLGQFPVDEPAHATLKIYGFAEEPVRLLEYEFKNKETAAFFDINPVELTPAEIHRQEAKSGIAVHLTVKPGLPLGRLRQAVILTTNLQNLAPIEAEVLGQAISDISIRGARWDERRSVLRFGMVPAAKGAAETLYLMIRGQHAEATEFSVAEVDPPLLHAELGHPERIAGSRAKRVPIVISVPPNSRPISRLGSSDEDRLGRVVLHTNHPKVSEIVLLVQFGVEG